MTSGPQSFPLQRSGALLKRFLAAIFVWLALSILGYMYGGSLVKTLEPYYKSIIEMAHPEYVARIDYDDNKSEPAIELWVTAKKPISYAPGQTVAAGTTIGPTKVTIFHTMVPLIIFGVIVLVWPVKSLKEFALLLLFALPGALIVTGITSPFQMLGLLDTAFIGAAARHGVEYQSGAFDWMRFTEGGARWLIPIIVGILCGRLANKLGRGGEQVAQA